MRCSCKAVCLLSIANVMSDISGTQYLLHDEEMNDAYTTEPL